MITPTATSMMNPVGLRSMMFMVCVVLQVVHGQHQIRCLRKEREALLQFKAAIVDHYGMLSSWTTPHCCQWQGIRCSNLTAHILSLDLPGKYPNFIQTAYISGGYISGEIHDSLMELPQLEYLNLSSNYFRNEKIPEFLGSLRNLKYLDLSSSAFGGEIPTELGSLSRLKYLNLANNHLNGSIPRQLGNLSRLQHFDLSDNAVEGNIPPQLGNLFQLQHLDLSDNAFEGNIPPQLGNLSRLHELYLGGYDINLSHEGQWLSNLLSLTHLYMDSVSNLNRSHTWLQVIAELPELRELSLVDCSLSDHFILSSKHSKFNFPTLSVLHLSQNTFTSPMVFEWVSNVTSNLVDLDLSENHLEGFTSSDFGMAMNLLRHLDISSNYFKARDLIYFMNICTLHSLNLYSNNLIEGLSSILSNLSSGCVRHSLQELDLSSNHITGTLSDISVFSSLKTLFLDGNWLSGTISEGVKLPSTLERLSISANSFKGGIPKSFGNACALRSFNMGANSLSDELPMIIAHLSGCARYSLQELCLYINQIKGTLPDFSTFTSLKRLYLYGNKLNGEIPKYIQFPPHLEELHVHSNSLKGVLSDYHFTNMSKLHVLDLSDNYLALTFTQNWVPLFQLFTIKLRSCKLGPTFPKWLQTQNNFFYIDISNAAISDIVPKWFWAKLPLQKVMTMNISYNNLQGIISNVSSKYVSRSMSLQSNQFEGSIPPFLRNSQILDLSKNKFSDSHSILCGDGTSQSLLYLDLSYNQLFGHIPDCWRQLNSLVYLDLTHNNFSGKIPTSMGSLVELQALLLRNNNLIERIPFTLRNCTMLVMLDMSDNKLSGSIPDWIGTKEELQILSLRKNQFMGSLPLEVCCLRNIRVLDLSINNLSGNIPKCIKNLTSMANIEQIHFGDHSYVINHGFYKLDRPYYLNALLTWKGSKQMFMDEGLSLLKSIDLSSNHFSEEIPVEIETLSALISLNLSRNNLTGEIPPNIGKLTSLDSLDLSRNRLVGLILQVLLKFMDLVC
ncbi:receptor-like protein EIX1 [Vigna umbellata]|uniref:receptor-like protein EIX1 n=1 Tax=Vigna umbellata TaxID=87088 RepID=UPI001F5EDFEA|nr:receptor-like protein EIX1 [Vigna umbellata]